MGVWAACVVSAVFTVPFLGFLERQYIESLGVDVYRQGLQKALDHLLAQPRIMARRRGKRGKIAEQDIRPFVFSAELMPPGEEGPSLRLLLQVGSKGGLSPFRFLEQLLPGEKGPAEQLWRLHRQGLYIYKETLAEPFPEGGEEKADG